MDIILFLITLVILGFAIYFLFRKKWKKSLYTFLAAIVCFGIFASIIPKIPNETSVAENNTTSSSSESNETSEVTESNDNQNEQETEVNNTETEYTATEDDVLSSISDFELFINNYKKMDPSLRTELWENSIYGTEVTWSGRLIGTLGDSLVLRADGPYIDGVGWSDLEDGEKYEVFIADFGHEIDEDFYQLGREITIKGDLESRGDPSLDYNWKLYNSSIVE